MYLSFLVSEFKKIKRDPMMLFMLFSPLFYIMIGRFIIPHLAQANDFDVMMIADYILVGLTLMSPLLYGALLGFSILDDRDDNILNSIRVSPLSINMFLSFRILMTLFLSFLSVMAVIYFSDIVIIPFKDIILIAFLASISTPLSAFFINVVANNKIEGFAVMKGFSTVLLIPIIALYFTDYKELFFAIFPGYWPAKIISIVIRGEDFSFLSYNIYYIIGIMYIIVLNVIVYRLFLKKI